jgi:predicted tellurium resistance membrane protein TerC
VVTAIGITRVYWVMAVAVILSACFMLFASGVLTRFISRHLRVKRIAIAFLIILGAVLFAEGLHWDIPKSYLYAALAFALFIELFIHLCKRKKRHD